jgi:hypothetical protein
VWTLAKPRAIYASIPPSEPVNPKWDQIAGVIPVEYTQPFIYWPDLDWEGDMIEDNSPTEYRYEHPKYLWSHPLVQDPANGETHVFIRQWRVGQPGATFDSQTIPPENLIFVINHAADDQYTMALLFGTADQPGSVQSPMGCNIHIPNAGSSWRNCKTYFYHLNLTRATPGTPINLMSEVVNVPQPGGKAAANPAMFTWIMYIYGCPA